MQIFVIQKYLDHEIRKFEIDSAVPGTAAGRGRFLGFAAARWLVSPSRVRVDFSGDFWVNAAPSVPGVLIAKFGALYRRWGRNHCFGRLGLFPSAMTALSDCVVFGTSAGLCGAQGRALDGRHGKRRFQN